MALHSEMVACNVGLLIEFVLFLYLYIKLGFAEVDHSSLQVFGLPESS